jgi:hypothetical protein
MLDENLLICMEQKTILLTHIMNLTKQIEVRCKQTEIIFDNLLEERKAYIDRVAKCNKLIDYILEKTESREKEHLQKILSVSAVAKASTAEEKRLLEYAINCKKYLRKILSLDKNTLRKLRRDHDEIREIIIKNHKKKNKTLFDNFK